MMNPKDWIKRDEGLRNKPYHCTAGKLSIGYGRNLDDNGISDDEADFLLDNDIRRCIKELMCYEWYNIQPFSVRSALINMCYNLGISRLLLFKNMLAALQSKDYEKAAHEALNSRWAKQVGERAQRIADVIRRASNEARS